ncbi:biotin--[acetyl-CoA-carboxylase] ligase [Kozakia baliensis]|nr:biotin--[acetyl-CoA-carboxylase] ligase [Kozakia baliensis]
MISYKLPIQWRLECHDELKSTSDFCRHRAEEGAAEGLAVLAFKQTTGRGTRGRHWIDPGGNLSFSLLLRPENPNELIRALPFICALAFLNALRKFAPDARLSLKWPNDILLDQKKLAGVLIERGEAKNPWIVIGMGANLKAAPTIPDRPLAFLGEVTIPPHPKIVAQAVLSELSIELMQWAEAGFAPLRQRWLADAHPLGTHLAVQRGDNYINGSFAGLDELGRLLLRTDQNETLSFVTGDILLIA